MSIVIILIVIVVIVIIVLYTASGANTGSSRRRRKKTSPRVTFMGKGTPSPPIKSLDFRGFDPSRLLIPRGGNSHVR